MSTVVQGTVVTVVLKFKDKQTGEAKEPDDARVWIWPPNSDTATELRYSRAEVTKLPGVGLYQFRLDTAPAAGDWEYEVQGTGAEAVVGQGLTTATPRRAVP